MTMIAVWMTRNRPVPRKRANFSVHCPKASGSTCSRTPRRSTRGWSSRARFSAMGLVPIGVAPPFGQQVVEDVIHRDGAQQSVVVVDDRRGDEVVRREVPGDLVQWRVRAQPAGVLLADAAYQRRGRLPEEALDVRGAEEAAGGGRLRRAHHVDQRGDRGGEPV